MAKASKTFGKRSIARPFRFYEFTADLLGPKPFPQLRRLLAQIRHLECKQMIAEELNPATCSDIQDELKHFQKLAKKSKGLTKATARCKKLFRLSFFSSDAHWRKKQLSGYVIVGVYGINVRAGQEGNLSMEEKENVQPRIIESLIPTSKPDACVPRPPRWKCRVQNQICELSGFPYTQPFFGVHSTCAQSTIKALLAAWSQDVSYPKILDKLCIRTLHEASVGLDRKKIEAVIRKLCPEIGVTPASYDSKRQASAILPAKWIYTSVESGFPAAMFFRCDGQEAGHIVPVFGHVYDKETWVGNAERSFFNTGGIITSEYWNSGFLIHDDIWGSNFIAPRDYLKPDFYRNPGNTIEPNSFFLRRSEVVGYTLTTHPKDVPWNPVFAEEVASNLMAKDLVNAIKFLGERSWTKSKRPVLSDRAYQWNERLIEALPKRSLVLRAILITPDDYFDHLGKIRDWSKRRGITSGMEQNYGPDGLETLRAYIESRKHKWIWMVEYSFPELYAANYRKVGEVLLSPADPNQPIGKRKPLCISWRLPGCILFPGVSDPSFPYFPIPSGIDCHSALYRCEHNDL